MPAPALTPALLAEVLRVYGITRSFMQTASITGAAYDSVCDAVKASRAPAPQAATPHPYPYRWRLRNDHPERSGQLCRIVHDSKVMRMGPGSRVLIEFQDGFRVEAMRGAVSKARGLAAASGGGGMAVDNRVAAPATKGVPILSDCSLEGTNFVVSIPGYRPIRPPREGCTCDVCEDNRKPTIVPP